ncbi:MAG: phosphate signaling complex protein PhoU [Proteobacteria bacterium]|nr:phosphate signaling complex protein PhoU [Pseudomonadota bacterium]
MLKDSLLAREINKLKDRFLLLGGEVEKSLRLALQAIEEGDEVLAQKVISGDRNIDLMEVDLEEECLKILALHQPVASDLRFIITVLKVNNDIERIGDHAVNLAEHAIALVDGPVLSFPFDYTTMSNRTTEMLKKSLDAFVQQNTTVAREVLAADDEVDEINRSMYRLVEEEMRKNPDRIGYLMNFIGISRCLERIGDLSTNIAEDVIYLVSGEIVRH